MILVQGLIKALYQNLFVKRFLQKTDRPRLQSCFLNSYIEMCRDKNDWRTDILSGESALQLDTTDPRHLDVRDHARCVVQHRRL